MMSLYTIITHLHNLYNLYRDMTALTSARITEVAYMESATATLVTMVMTAAKATPSLSSRVTMSSVKMAPSATTLPTIVGLSASVLQASPEHSVNGRSSMIRALARLAVAMDSVLRQKEGKPPNVTATKAGEGTPAIRQSISAKKRANRVETTANV